MGKIKKLIPLITIETAVILMLFSQYIFILDVTKYTNNFIFGFFDLAFGYLYIIKYIAALIIMYLIVHDKKGIVSGYIGMAYVLLSGLFLIYNFFNYYDYETPLLEQFFIYFDPFIIYIAFAIVFICFITEKGKKSFLFIVTLAVTIADMIVGSVYYYGYVTNYSYTDGIYSSFESFLLNVINTDFCFHWCLCCFIFAVETILILIFAIPARKKESDAEKDEEIKIPTILITVLVSLLLSFLTIILVLRPLIKSFDYANYEDSFAHKVIEWIPQTADRMAKVSSKQILSENLFDLDEDAEWVFYPEDNMIGLVAIAKEDGDRENTIILAFRYLKSAKNIRSTIINYDYLDCSARYGGFSFDDPELYEKKKIYFVKLKYDNRIVEPRVIRFDKDDERVNIDISDDNIELSHCYFGSKIIRVKHQNYDASTGMWGEVITEESNWDLEPGIPYVQWQELQVVDGANLYRSEDGIDIVVHRYDYEYPQYNIFGEIVKPQKTEMYVYICCNDGLSDEILSEINNVKLYHKNGESYEDITPKDFTVEPNGLSEYQATYNLESDELGELTEGNYILKYGEYNVEFELKIQTFEAW
ncbi:MAG: hypothetical protein J6X97_02105 [Lachnospiraceae bacterium]|nr:hypothetical protein [Lachnospiraceae bacterium]